MSYVITFDIWQSLNYEHKVDSVQILILCIFSNSVEYCILYFSDALCKLKILKHPLICSSDIGTQSQYTSSNSPVLQNSTRQESSMIHSANPQSTRQWKFF